jgi:hypothetical protein
VILAHRCRSCGHTELEARSNADPKSRALADLRKKGCLSSCSCQSHDFGPPEVIPSFTNTGKPIEQLAEPGATLSGALKTCTCTACKAKYAESVGTA